MRNEEDVFQTRDPFAGTPLALQRECSPEVARPVARIAMKGAGQSARAAARARSEWSRERCYRVVVFTLTHKAEGLTRSELHEYTGIPMNTINPVVRELCDLPPSDPQRCYTEGRRGTESIVRLAVTPPTED